MLRSLKDEKKWRRDNRHMKGIIDKKTVMLKIQTIHQLIIRYPCDSWWLISSPENRAETFENTKALHHYISVLCPRRNVVNEEKNQFVIGRFPSHGVMYVRPTKRQN